MFSTAGDITYDYSENLKLICFKSFLFLKSKVFRFNKIHYARIYINLININMQLNYELIIIIFQYIS